MNPDVQKRLAEIDRDMLIDGMNNVIFYLKSPETITTREVAIETAHELGKAITRTMDGASKLASEALRDDLRVTLQKLKNRVSHMIGERTWNSDDIIAICRVTLMDADCRQAMETLKTLVAKVQLEPVKEREFAPAGVASQEAAEVAAVDDEGLEALKWIGENHPEVARIWTVRNSTMGVCSKIEEIMKIDPVKYLPFSSSQWADFLKCDDRTVRNCPWWTTERPRLQGVSHAASAEKAEREEKEDPKKKRKNQY